MIASPVSERELLPMSVGDIFDEAFDLYKRNFALFAGIAALIHVPMSLLLQVLIYLARTQSAEGGAAKAGDPDFASILLFACFVLAIAVCYVVLYIIQTGALSLAVSDRHLGRLTSIGNVYRRLMDSFGALLGTWVLLGAFLIIVSVLVNFAGLFLIGIIGLAVSPTGSPGEAVALVLFIFGFGLPILLEIASYVMLGVFVTPAVVIEQLSFVTAITRNFQLVHRGFWRVNGGLILVVFLFLALFLSLRFSVLGVVELTLYSWIKPSLLVENVVAGVWTGVLMIFLQPYVTVALTLLYFDQRVRRDGYDLAILSQKLVQPALEGME